MADQTIAPKYAELCERLSAKKEVYNPSKDAFSKRLRNPDGPEAATAIADLQAELERVKGALEGQLARLETTKAAMPGHAPLTDPVSFDLGWNDAIDTAIVYVRAALLPASTEGG